jgi:hypothetical protein
VKNEKLTKHAGSGWHISSRRPIYLQNQTNTREILVLVVTIGNSVSIVVIRISIPRTSGDSGSSGRSSGEKGDTKRSGIKRGKDKVAGRGFQNAEKVIRKDSDRLYTTELL